jgi:hypothetical protein
MLFNGSGKKMLCLFYLHTDLGQVGYFHRRAVLGDQRLHVKTIKVEIAFIDFQSFLGKIESLLYEIKIGVVH